nr:hypothetical protein [Tanacetum cinerariifolium]
MIPEPEDPNRKVPVNETFHVQTDNELTEKELKQIGADDQAIQNILLGFLKDIYAAVDSCEKADCSTGYEYGSRQTNADGWMQWWEPVYTTKLLIAQKEEAGIQLQAEEFDLVVVAVDLDEIEEVNTNYILMANFSKHRHRYRMSGIRLLRIQEFKMLDIIMDSLVFKEMEIRIRLGMYTELLKPIPEPHQVPQNENNSVIYEVSSVEQDGGTVDQHPATVKEIRTYFESLYNNLAIEVEKFNSVNSKMKETNDNLTTELARYKN